VLEADIYKLIGSDLVEDLKNPQGKINQRGSGKHTLCHRCNNDTGGWYGRAYVEFARGLFPLCDMVQPNTFVELAFASCLEDRRNARNVAESSPEMWFNCNLFSRRVPHRRGIEREGDNGAQLP
jgi:hypothetical protein